MKLVNVKKLELLLDDLKHDGWSDPANAVSILVNEKRDSLDNPICGFYGIYNGTKYGVEIRANGRVYIVGFNKMNSETFYV